MFTGWSMAQSGGADIPKGSGEITSAANAKAKFEQGAILQGYVKDRNGTAIEGASVFFEYYGNTSSFKFEGRAVVCTSDANGH